MPRPPNHSPSVRRRRLARELRKLRADSHKSGQVAAKEIGWQHSKLTRIERAAQGIPVDDLAVLLTVYDDQVDERERAVPGYRAALFQLARDATTPGWWCSKTEPGGVFAKFDSLPDFEAGASFIRTYEAQVVPGLMQTPDYAAAVFSAGRVHDPAVVQRHIEGRLKRQEILNSVHPPRLDAVIDEGALRRLVGGREVMAEQLQHLENLAARHSIDIRVLPFAAGAHAATLGPFIILDFPDPLDSSIAFSESAASSVFLEESHQLDRYTEVYGSIQGSALVPAQSVDFIRQVKNEMEAE